MKRLRSEVNFQSSTKPRNTKHIPSKMKWTNWFNNCPACTKLQSDNTSTALERCEVVLITCSSTFVGWRCRVAVKRAISRGLPLALPLSTARRTPRTWSGCYRLGDDICTFNQGIVLVQLSLSCTGLSKYWPQEITDFILNRNRNLYCCIPTHFQTTFHDELTLNTYKNATVNHILGYSFQSLFCFGHPQLVISWSNHN